MDGTDTLATALAVGPLGYEPREVRPRLSAMVMRTDRSLQEYLRIHLRLRFLPDITPLASTFDFVADAAPGVKEVLGVGKVCWEVREGSYDLVVVDAEASGHVVAQISSPRTINSLVPRGPLRDQTRWMLAILDDHETCGVVVVTTPEELPVTESAELVGKLRAETRTAVAALVTNAMEPGLQNDAVTLANDHWFSSVAPLHATAVRASQERRRIQDECVGVLADLGAPVIELPFVAGDEPAVVEALAGVLASSDTVGGQ